MFSLKQYFPCPLVHVHFYSESMIAESFESIGKVSGHFFEVACQLFMPGIPSVSKYIKGITYEVLAHKEPRSSICNELWKILLLLLSVSNYYPAKIMCVIVESNSAFNCFFQKSLARCWKERFEFSRQLYTTFHLWGTQTHRDRPSNWSKLRHAMTFGMPFCQLTSSSSQNLWEELIIVI